MYTELVDKTMCSPVCPCNIADNGNWKGLAQESLTPFNRKVYTEDYEAAKADPTALYFQAADANGLKVYDTWLLCYDDI